MGKGAHKVWQMGDAGRLLQLGQLISATQDAPHHLLHTTPAASAQVSSESPWRACEPPPFNQTLPAASRPPA